MSIPLSPHAIEATGEISLKKVGRPFRVIQWQHQSLFPHIPQRGAFLLLHRFTDPYHLPKVVSAPTSCPEDQLTFIWPSTISARLQRVKWLKYVGTPPQFSQMCSSSASTRPKEMWPAATPRSHAPASSHPYLTKAPSLIISTSLSLPDNLMFSCLFLTLQ